MTPSRRRSIRPYPSRRYGMAHKAMCRRLDPVVPTGTVPCARCGELIQPDTAWQLDHRDDGRGWLGPSHRRCNARAGWEMMVAVNGNGGGLQEQPYRWSQRRYDDPPPGTTANIAGEPGMVEVYLGHGIWQTVPRGSVGT